MVRADGRHDGIVSCSSKAVNLRWASGRSVRIAALWGREFTARGRIPRIAPLVPERAAADMRGMDQEYLERFACALGRLIGNFWSLEWMLRNVLYHIGHPPHTMMAPRPLFSANVGDRFPVNALTSYASLGQLIDAYNATTTVPIDRSFVTLRDTLAHGRVLCADETWVNLALMKFSRPDASGMVNVETHYDLTLDWMNDQIAQVGDALARVMARYRELGGT